MCFKKHIYYNCILLLLIISLLNNYFVNINYFYLLISSILTCLLPDIDHKKSFLGSKLIWLSCIINHCFKHRHFTHSLLCIMLLSFFIVNLDLIFNYKLNINIIKGMIIGYINHILLDISTFNGVIFFWPLNLRIKLSFVIIYNVFVFFLYFLIICKSIMHLYA